MATVKITGLPLIESANVTANDLFHVIDVDATSGTYPTGTNKRVTATDLANRLAALNTATMPPVVQTELDLKLSIADFNSAGLKIAAPVVAATVAPITLSTTVAGNSIDGVTLVAGNRLLVKNQSVASENGIYIINSTGLTEANRATDFDTAGEINNGFVLVNGGLTQAGSGWAVTSTLTTAQNAVGTESIVFTQFAAGLSGLSKASVGLGNVDNTNDLSKPLSTATITALADKQGTLTGSASTIATVNLTASRVLITDTSGKVAVSPVTSTELGHLSGTSSNILTSLSNISTSLSNKANSANPIFTGTVNLPTGTATASPLKFTAGTELLGTSTSGSVEFDGTNLYFTPASTRKTIAFTDSALGAGVVGNAQLASGLTLGGTTSGTFSGPLTGNATTATTAGSTTSFTGNLAGDVTGTQGATAISAATITGKALTGYVSGAGTVSTSDTILTAINKLNGNDGLKAPLASPVFTGTVVLPAGTSSVAPLRIPTAVALLTTPVAGSFEFSSPTLYFTPVSSTRKIIAFTSDITNYTHPTGDGNLHVPATSTTNNGKVLTAGSTAGSISWATPVIYDTIIPKTGNFTLVLGDAGSYIRIIAGTSNTVITIPTHTSVPFPIGTDIKFYNRDAGGNLSFSKAGVTVNNDQIALITAGEVFAIKKVAQNEWDFI